MKTKKFNMKLNYYCWGMELVYRLGKKSCLKKLMITDHAPNDQKSEKCKKYGVWDIPLQWWLMLPFIFPYCLTLNVDAYLKYLEEVVLL